MQTSLPPSQLSNIIASGRIFFSAPYCGFHRCGTAHSGFADKQTSHTRSRDSAQSDPCSGFPRVPPRPPVPDRRILSLYNVPSPPRTGTRFSGNCHLLSLPSVAVTDHHIAAARAKRKVQGMFQCPVNPSITSHVFTCPDMICAVSWFYSAVCIARPKAPESSETILEADNIEIPFCPPSVSTGMSRS